MNRLPIETRRQILHLMVEGSSMRSISRLTGTSINTVTKLLVDAGTACNKFHHQNVKNVPAGHIECDEIWSFCYAKKKTVQRGAIQGTPDYAGDVWTWTALDRNTRMILAWYVAPSRIATFAVRFMAQLHRVVQGEAQISTDGLGSYISAVREAFGPNCDFGQLVKQYDSRGRHTGDYKYKVSGHPDLSQTNTTYMERHNLTTRMSLRRYTRKTNGHSKKMQNHVHALSLYFVWYNFCRVHSTFNQTPAMKAGLTSEPYNFDWILGLMDSLQPAKSSK